MLQHWIWLAQCSGISLREKHKLLAHFSDPEDLYAADSSQLPEAHREALLDKSLAEAERIWEDCVRKQAKILTFDDPAYPRLLKEIEDPPLVLYYKGTLPDFSQELLIAAVGTRKASAYGLTTAKRMAHRISRCGAVVVTGLAYGNDSAAAAGALAAGGCVVGVLGCPIDKIYPASNRELYGWVERQGCLLSEYPPGARTYPSNFIQRNRIISGISQGVLVVEAPEKSGALNTAHWCLEQGRDVFVVPGNVDTVSCAGSNALLRQGATPIMNGWELVQEYADRFPDKLHKDETPLVSYPNATYRVAEPTLPVEPAETDKKAVDKLSLDAYSGVNMASRDLNPAEAALLKQMTPGEEMTDELLARCGMPRTEALSALTTLTLKGYVRSLPGKRVTRIK